MHKRANRFASSASRIENLAADILGTRGRAGINDQGGDSSHAVGGGMGRVGEGEEEQHETSTSVLQVIGKLQKEISLDTQAITAFQGEMKKVLDRKGVKATDAKLKVGMNHVVIGNLFS